MIKTLASMFFGVYLNAMTTLLRSIAIFFILLVATSVAFDVFKLDFGSVNFWDKHGIAFLILIAFFPRLTLLFSSVASGGFLWWLGWAFCPRILVALLATVAYFHTNPMLVVISWFVALGGETAEKFGLGGKRSKFVFRTYRSGPSPFGGHTAYQEPEIRQTTTIPDKDNAIETEFKKL